MLRMPCQEISPSEITCFHVKLTNYVCNDGKISNL